MTETRRKAHHVHETKVLSYGHLGTAAYDDQNHKWTFLRQYQTQHGDGLEAWESQTNSPPFLLADERTWNAEPDYVQACGPAWDARLGHGLQNSFLKRVPDVAVAAVELPTLLKSIATELSYQPSASILAFGHARRASDHSVHNKAPYIPIVAIRSCSSNETLQFFVIEADQIGIPSIADLSDLGAVPFIAHEASGCWTGSTDRILQVTSSSYSQGTQFLVVKPSGTTVLRPVLSKSRASEELLEPCPVITIPQSRTGSQPHAFAAFNPHDQRLVALVDTSGQWSIWKLTGRRLGSARNSYQATLKASNALGSIEHQFRFSGASTSKDTWYRVCWFTSREGIMDRLLVYNRRFAAAFDRTGSCLGGVDMRLGSQADQTLILDVKNSSRRSSHVFVLTTSRLLIFDSSQTNEDDRSSGEALKLACSWNHYRDRADWSLRMAILESSEESWVLLYSNTSHLAIIYRFGQADGQSTIMSKQDPSTFQLPHQLKGRMKDVDDITMCPVAFSSQSQPAGVVGSGLIKLVACLATGEVIEALYKHELDQFSLSSHPAKPFLHLFIPRRLNHPISSKYVMADDDIDDFVVPDGKETDDFGGKPDSEQNTPEDVQYISPSPRHWQRLLQYEALKNNDNGNVSFGSALQQAIEQFERRNEENKLTFIQLISDLADRCRITELEHDSQLAEQWHDTLELQGDINVQLAAHVVGGVPISSRRHLLLDLYEGLVRAYLGSLSDQVTDRGRVNRERLIRQIVGDCFLGSFVLAPATTPLSVSPRRSWLQTQDSQPLSPSQGLNSDDPESSHAVTPEDLSEREAPAVSRLRKYTLFRHEMPPPLLDYHANISNILAHLPESIEENPADYSYQQTSQKMKLAQEEIAAESLNPRERKKALRSAARLQRKLEKTQLISQEVATRRNLLPGISSGPKASHVPQREVQSSQPVAPSSSQTIGPGLSMTQPERGAYGTRQAEKKGKKGAKRRAGF
ncbi:hypothetical protein Z517_05531 [Fonsecaea pedrosoi CBS 271.37]|uniref:RNA polymerase I-specific transcription initiation factor RRN6-like protein n=1 Tax=Fonsecaea pedrosoi CBS 271.37 TaxID=1442368 RepID=A0A0D2HDH9_9EURO|nr:uncharacterized protein Z517_05531 [Fonsecaea pedrosoi CBS 271.37]KIW82504.1 hypothetical protein Z517_05531 [Fonsecaea pedrosoi CBS 271.37]